MTSPPQKPPDEELLVRIQEGDRSAFETLFRSYYEELCAFVDAKIGASDYADDIVQNVFLSLWRRRQELEIRSTLRAYLYGAARNESITYRRRRRERSQTEDQTKRVTERIRDWASLSPAETLERDELKAVIQESIDALPERRREVYVLSRQHGLTYKEIAIVMDISPKTVDTQMVAALKFLRKRLQARSSRAL